MLQLSEVGQACVCKAFRPDYIRVTRWTLPSPRSVLFLGGRKKFHFDPSAEGEKSRDSVRNPTPDASPLRLGQHDVFGAPPIIRTAGQFDTVLGMFPASQPMDKRVSYTGYPVGRPRQDCGGGK